MLVTLVTFTTPPTTVNMSPSKLVSPLKSAATPLMVILPLARLVIWAVGMNAPGPTANAVPETCRIPPARIVPPLLAARLEPAAGSALSKLASEDKSTTLSVPSACT